MSPLPPTCHLRATHPCALARKSPARGQQSASPFHSPELKPFPPVCLAPAPKLKCPSISFPASLAELPALGLAFRGSASSSPAGPRGTAQALMASRSKPSPTSKVTLRVTSYPRGLPGTPGLGSFRADSRMLESSYLCVLAEVIFQGQTRRTPISTLLEIFMSLPHILGNLLSKPLP